MNLYCPKCKERRVAQVGAGASIMVNGKPADYSILKGIMRCGECGSSLVAEEDLIEYNPHKCLPVGFSFCEGFCPQKTEDGKCGFDKYELLSCPYDLGNRNCNC